MPLSAGVMLGPYEIQSPLGRGGMGEVYRARDIRLDRCVAIKILPAHLSSNPEAKQRFDVLKYGFEICEGLEKAHKVALFIAI